MGPGILEDERTVLRKQRSDRLTVGGRGSERGRVRDVREPKERENETATVGTGGVRPGQREDGEGGVER